ncbi:D-amino acid oxidase [Ilyonectria sp. MPI-CAGE-AT-0026]|nr:D-amino acid oxidase [Ilyonectria sp. MPI-CAGE-AT-0026]
MAVTNVVVIGRRWYISLLLFINYLFHKTKLCTGLTTALLLSEDSSYSISVIAKHMPGDYDIEYASPWAGANYMPVSITGTPAQSWERDTWPALENLARNQPEAGVQFQDLKILNRKKDGDTVTAKWFAGLLSDKPWWSTVFPNYCQIPNTQLKEGVDSGHAMTSVCINTAIYLPWLVGECLKRGVVFKRAELEHIKDASTSHHSGEKPGIIVNCTGLGSLTLKGVCDLKLHPARGQIVLVRNESNGMTATSGTDDGPDEAMYVMCRPAGGGTILGGCYQRDNWDSQPDPNLAIRIMQRCVAAHPELTGGRTIEALDVIRHGVGLRPARDGGARVEKELIEDTWVIHNYGHGGAGYQCSYGCAKAVVELLDAHNYDKPRL